MLEKHKQSLLVYIYYIKFRIFLSYAIANQYDRVTENMKNDSGFS